jgi:signal transduction histidine kinase/CHASE3 domain sensor protein
MSGSGDMPVPTPAPRRTPARNTSAMMGALIIFLVFLIGVVIYTDLLGREAYNNARRAEDLLLTEREINSALLDMETSMRGFVIAGEEGFLQPYNAAKERLPRLQAGITGQIANLQDLDGSTREQIRRQVEDLFVASDNWQRDWAGVQIDNRRLGRTQEAFDAIAAGHGKALFDAFREAGRNLNSTLAAQLERYRAELNNIRWFEVGVILVLGLLALVGAVLTMRTARRELRREMEATRRIETEHRQLQAVVDNLPIAVRVMDAPGSNVILQNQSAEEIFPAAVWNKMTRGERIQYFDLRRPDGTPVTLEDAPVARALGEGRSVRDVELITTRPETGTKHLMVSATPIKDESGRITSSVILIQDVTRLRVIDQRKDEFIAIAAHELRNPLAALVGYNHLAHRTLAKVQAGSTSADDALPSIERYLGEIGKQTERLTKLITRLLDASRVQLGRLNLEKAPVELVKMAEEAITNAQTTDAGAHEIELSAPPDLTGHWDPTRIEQVITNLLDNALRYSPLGTSVRLSITQEGDVARVEITDQGPGIPDHQRPHLFSRYFGPLPNLPSPDGSPGPRKKRGLGLGLYVSSEIVAAHGGEIGFRPNPDAGSTFWFTLPLAEAL